MVLATAVAAAQSTASLSKNGGLKLTVKLDDSIRFQNVTDGFTSMIVEYHSGRKGRDVTYEVARFNADASRRYAFLSRSVSTMDTDDTLQRMCNFIDEGHGFIILTAVVNENGKVKNIKFGLQ
jgi:hypothetical protein